MTSTLSDCLTLIKNGSSEKLGDEENRTIEYWDDSGGGDTTDTVT